ncbi:MAG TPA: GAF domain-containing SpoIIE family protein phosphatase [Bryobacteraceae bacterium]|nr:GAF domain-containing SpoIIE family protein phosphatase [Bryobacteraceae bacterium]
MPPRVKPAIRFRERSELLDFLLEISSVTAETLDIEKLLPSVADIVRRVVAYDLFAILLYNDKRQDLRIRYAVGHREEVVRNLAIPLGEGIVGAAAATREPVLVTDVRSDPRYLPTSDIVCAELSVPMVVRGRLAGVLDVQSTRKDAFGDYDRAMLQLIATRVGAAIDNAQLYRRAERQYKTLRALSKISHEFSSLLDIDELLSKIASSVRSLINYDAFSILLVDPELQFLRHRFSMRYDERVNLDNIPLGRGITGAAVTSREIVRVHDTGTDPRYIPSHPGIRSEIAVPLALQQGVIGVMDLESERIGYFTEEHARTLSVLAPSVAIAVENARLYEEIGDRERRMQEDLKAAFELQTILLPQEAPPVEGLDIAIGLRPARQISGDLYDFFEHQDSHVVVAFGDSSGKGAAAALYGAVVNGLMRTMAPRRRSPAELMKALNDALVQRIVEGRYVTLLLMLWHPHTRSFTLSNAGSSPPMVIRDRQILKIQIEGVPLGLLPHRDYEERSFAAKPGDLLVLFSDGVSDHLSLTGEEYGRERLAGVLTRACALPTKEIVQAIFDDLDEFNTVRFDDQTLIVMRVQ